MKANLFLERYFRGHVLKVSKDEQAGPAVLSVAAEAEMAALYEKVVFQEADFIAGSRQFAKRLNGIMENDRRIVPGVLAVCVLTHGSPVEMPMLALLKLNVTHAVVHREIEDEAGHTEIKLEVIPDALPTVGERLQKAALVWKSENPGWEMLVLDRQVGKGEERPAANFFRDFLGAEWKLTPEVLTHRVFGTVAGVASTYHKSDKPEDWALADTLFRTLDTSLERQDFNPVDFIANLNVDETAKKKVSEAFDKAAVMQVFRVHRDTADSLTSKVRYRGDLDLMLNASSEAYDQMVHETEIERDGTPMKRVCITTRCWQRILRRK
jgi:hypothetical protein